MVTAYQRGNPIVFENGLWVYQDDGSSIDVERPCVLCKIMPTPEGYDPCLGFIPRATSACCGHGIERGYVVYEV